MKLFLINFSSHIYFILSKAYSILPLKLFPDLVLISVLIVEWEAIFFYPYKITGKYMIVSTYILMYRY
jgi:hypothetical protein